MVSVDPQASPRFYREQRELFRNLAEVPLSDWSYQVDRDAVAAPARAGADETWAPRVELSYAIDGVDVVPTSRELHYTFVRHGESWYIADERGDGDKQSNGWGAPWYYGVCRVARTDSSVIIGHDSNQELIDRVARMTDDAVETVTEVWGTEWPQQVGIVLPESQQELQDTVGPAFAVDGIAAVAVADKVDTEARRVEGPRVVLNPKTADNLTDSALRVVIQHEITHVAARADTVDGAPMWMLEGFADYVGYRGSTHAPKRIAPELVSEIERSGLPDSLPADHDFHLGGRSLDLAYQQAWSAVDFLARRYGEQRIVELYHRVAGSRTDAEADAALRAVTGMNTSQFTAEWREDLSKVFS